MPCSTPSASPPSLPRAWRPTTSTRPAPPGPSAHDWNCVIITSDRDAFAHISDHTQRPAPHRRRHQRFAAARPRSACTIMYGVAAAQLPRVRRPARRRERQPARRLGHRREDRGDPAGRRRARWTRCGPTSTTTTGRSLAAALDGWAAETGARRLGARRRTTSQRARRPGALRLQRRDDVGPRRPRPRAHPRRPRHARACCRSTSTGSAGSWGSSASTPPPTSRSACSPATRRHDPGADTSVAG